MTRDYYPATSSTEPVTSSNTVNVKVDRHTNLQSRERLTVSWSGAHPTGGRAGNPYGEKGIDQEYPVAIFECRGVDDPTAPAADQISPDTCWTNTIQERSQSDDADRSIWRDDRYADPADTGQVSGVDEADLPADCPTRQTSTAYHYTPFRAADGTVYAACDAEHLPPEAAVGSVDPPNEVFAYTGVDGQGTAQFEVRTESENESLGCSDKVACTLVVVPIMGLSCADATRRATRPAPTAGLAQRRHTGAQQAVSGSLWWTASNWRNRITVPLGFALPAEHLHAARPGCTGAVLRLRAAQPGRAAVVAGLLPQQVALQLAEQRHARRGGVQPDDGRHRCGGRGDGAPGR